MSTAGKRKGWRELAKFRETYEYGGGEGQVSDEEHAIDFLNSDSD